MKQEYGDYLFEGIEIIKRSRYSHYLISHEGILEISAMEAIFHVLEDINDRIDRARWGYLYPPYRVYKRVRHQLRHQYRHNKFLKKHPLFK